MSREQMLREASNVFCEFLEVAVHTLLYTRGVYPPEIFERRRKYNIPVRQSRYKELNQYISGAVQGAHFWMVKGVLEKVVLCIEDKSTGRKLERFVWEIDFDMAASPALSTSSRVLTEPKNQEELEDALRQVLLKISVSDSLLPPQKRKDVRKITQQAAVVFPRRPTALNITYIFLKCSVSPIWHQCPARTAPYSHTRFRRRITADQKPLAVGAGNIQPLRSHGGAPIRCRQ
uniref:HORMA domain-containing protein n=1 Tax=Cryptomonas curvata TaxID=233186 RepID=A0A7S0MSC4_9CRYP|mmetsp:Transcript_51550/g.107723  ORF Transcript_51550/g.107723 Transcript_51550/m.107723 type:complete len:232 (+) Transcript_51550:174-869(+)